MSERDTRYGHRSGSGSNQPKRHERKEQDPEWRPRQGGDQTRGQEDQADRRGQDAQRGSSEAEADRDR
jgi:hypothetical protein